MEYFNFENEFYHHLRIPIRRGKLSLQQQMENSWLLLTLLSALAIAFISTVVKRQRRRRPKRKLPPGPKPWPLVGNLNLLGSIPHQSLHHLSRKYGEIMLLHFGKHPVVVASSPEMARQFLKVHDAVFASRPTFAAYKHVSYNYSDVSFSPYGPYWREARKIFITKVLSNKKLDSSEGIRVAERRRFLSRLRSLSGKPVLLRDVLSRFTLSIICRMIFTDRFVDELEEGKSVVDMDELREMVEEWLFLNGVFNVGEWIPWLGFLDLQGYVKKMKALRRKMERFTDFVIDDHLAKRAAEKESVDKDFVDVLLERAEETNGEVEFTRDCVKALIMNLLVAAADTSAITVEWAIHEILKQPLKVEKAKAELNRVIGRNRWVEENDIPQLPYVEAIIKETLRLHPIATLLAPHFAMRDCDVAGYNIAKGTMVVVNVWSMGRDPKLWDAAEEFLPERFVGNENEIDMTGSNFALLPFGSGRRRCPGYNLGLKVVRTTLANLLHGFELKLDEGVDISMEENYGLTTSPKHPLSIIVKPILPHHLY